MQFVTPDRISGIIRQQCPSYCGNVGACPHLRNILDGLAESTLPANEQLAALVWEYFIGAKTCASMLSTVLETVNAVSTHLLDAVLGMDGDFEPRECASSSYQAKMKTRAGGFPFKGCVVHYGRKQHLEKQIWLCIHLGSQ